MRRLLPWVAAALSMAAAQTAFAAQTTDVDQAEQRFSQSSLRLHVGDRVRFLNQDDVTHNISIVDADGNATDQGLQRPGQAIETAFDKAGRFVVRCSIHPRMRMTIAVD